MANTEFVKQAAGNETAIKWKDIFSDYRKPHTKADFDQLMLSGSSLVKYRESEMFQHWQKPWLFWRFLMIGLAAIAALYAAEGIVISMNGVCTYSAFNLLVLVIPPMVPPIALMIFFWELNVPRNISIYQLAGFFAAGGLASLVFTVVIDHYFPTYHAYAAPISEEPAKLLASVLFMQMIAKKTNIRIYGVTGLCIGAAVGAGFGAFESAQYAYNEWIKIGGGVYMISPMLSHIFWNSHFLRGVLAVGGHTLFCAPYSAAVALHSQDNKIDASALQSNDFYRTFLTSVVVHFLWNGGLGIMNELEYNLGYAGILLGCGALSIVLWSSTLSITQKCMHQLTAAASYRIASPRHDSKELVLHIFSNGTAEKKYRISSNQKQISIGRSGSCNICLPSIQGLSRQHGMFQFDQRQNQWFYTDTNSSNGSFTKDGKRMQSGQRYPVSDGTYIYLGGKNTLIAISGEPRQ